MSIRNMFPLLRIGCLGKELIVLKEIVPLSELPVNTVGQITGMLFDEPHLKRLTALGFVPGAPVQKVMTAASGDPSAYRICSCVIALRSSDASRILVSADDWSERQ